MDNKVKIFVGVIVVLILGVGITAAMRGKGTTSTGPGEYDEFATCLKDKGAIFYGAFWCPHCRDQKKLFGSSERLLPYVECSTADGRGQVPACTEKNVTSYPTWEFADGTRLNGELSLAQLAEKTSCVLPGNEVNEVTGTPLTPGSEGVSLPVTETDNSSIVVPQ